MAYDILVFKFITNRKPLKKTSNVSFRGFFSDKKEDAIHLDKHFKIVPSGIKLEKHVPYKSLVLHSYEIDLLKHIYIHRQLRAPSVHELIKVLSGKNIESSNISNRLRKLVESGAVNRNKELIHDMSGNFVRYSYRVGTRGLEVLKFLNIITKDQVRQYLSNPHNNKFPAFHNKVASTITNSISIALLKTQIDFRFCRGINHYLLGNDNYTKEIEHRGLIIPDYVFEDDNKIVCIEIDTGTQRTQVISSKIQKYIKQANSKEFRNFDLHIVFVVVDNSISDTYETDRARRVYSLKSTFLARFELPSNLHLYAINSIHSPTLISNILNPQNILETIEQDFMCEDFMELYNERYNQYFKKVEIEPAPIRFNGVYEYSKSGTKHIIYLMYRMAADLSDYQKSESAIRYLSSRITASEKIILMYVYDNASSALSDVTSAADADITIAASYVPEEDEELVVYKHTALLTKKAVKGVIL